MIRFICSSCSEHLAVPEQDGGTIGWCHRCRNPYTAPRSTAAIGVMERRQPLPPPPPITIPKPLMIFRVIVAGVILVGSLYAIIDSARSKLPPSARADNPAPQVPPPNPIPSADAARPEADVNGEPWTFDPQPRIRTSFPLTAHYLQKLPTDEFQITPEQVNATIYFGDPNGRISALNPQTLQVEKHKLGNGFYGLSREGTKLKAALDQPFRFQTIAEFDQPIESGDSDDVFDMSRKLGGYELPNDWLMPAPTVYFRGKYYSCAVGSVKVLDKGVASEFKTPLKNLKFWKIALLPTGPAGFDNWGVFELDEHLCPIKRVINLRNAPNENHITSCLAGDGQTLCFVSTGSNTTWMQIWSLDARSKLREIEVPFKLPQSSSRRLFLETNR